jgi:hypothetical protein
MVQEGTPSYDQDHAPNRPAQPIKNRRSFLWDHDPSVHAFDGYPAGPRQAAVAAVAYAEHVFECDAELAGADFASQIQRRQDARVRDLVRRLPFEVNAEVRQRAATILATEGHAP